MKIELKEDLLILTKMLFEMKFESKANTSLVSLSSFDLNQYSSIKQILLYYNNKMNRVRIEEQLIVLRKEAESRSSNRFHTEIANLPLFNGKASKIRESIIVCKLYIRMKIREMIIKE